MRIVGLGLLAMMLQGCVAAAVGGAAGGGYYVYQDQRPAGVIASDAKITSEINLKMISDSRVKALQVDVDTFEGVVTLSGEVPTQTSHMAVIEIAKSVRGVRRIEDKVRVSSPAAQY